MTKDIILPLSEAMIAYDAGNYDDAIEIVYPIRYNIFHTGGSNAQVMKATLCLISFNYIHVIYAIY